MKVYAKFRIDIDKEDESIYTQKAVNLMQKLGCKAEKLYSSMERYTFTVDIKEAGCNFHCKYFPCQCH